jgi:hypothetical protein
MTDTDITNTAVKQKGEEEGGENESEEEGKRSELVSHSMVLQCVDMSERCFAYSDTTATRKICTAVRKSLSFP